uniref:Synaptobrevin, longin-like domain protein n=1 Tax=Tanacetum cinerariifolium TaxID=118510 RepID=A0A6L2JJX1_TANCI|nr:hypothetical protein [Tanacetum cinerariifolium]
MNIVMENPNHPNDPNVPEGEQVPAAPDGFAPRWIGEHDPNTNNGWIEWDVPLGGEMNEPMIDPKVDEEVMDDDWDDEVEWLLAPVTPPNSTIYTSCINQFWTSAKVKTVNDEIRIQALVDGKRVNIKESFIRHTLRLDDPEGTSCLTNIEIFEGLAKTSAKTTSWNEFSSTMASTIIFLATNQKFNFSRYILLSLVKNIEAGVPFFMFPRIVQLIINHQLGDIAHHKEIFDTRSLTKKVFANMKRVGTGFSREVTPLFDNMLVQAHEEIAKQTLPSPSNDPLPSGKDTLKLKELIDLCTNFSNKIFELESKVINIKSTYQERIDKLEGRVERLEEENRVLKELKSASTDDAAKPIMEKEKSSKQEGK